LKLEKQYTPEARDSDEGEQAFVRHVVEKMTARQQARCPVQPVFRYRLGFVNLVHRSSHSLYTGSMLMGRPPEPEISCSQNNWWPRF
jgi:hypothetical protein